MANKKRGIVFKIIFIFIFVVAATGLGYWYSINSSQKEIGNNFELSLKNEFIKLKGLKPFMGSKYEEIYLELPITATRMKTAYPNQKFSGELPDVVYIEGVFYFSKGITKYIGKDDLIFTLEEAVQAENYDFKGFKKDEIENDKSWKEDRK